MTKEDWSSLQACPGWDALKRYLLEFRTELANRMADGSAPHPETMYRCQALKDLATLEWKDIAGFYDLEPEV